MKTIRLVEDFSRTPVGRFRTDGPDSGERFREDFLRPAIATGDPVEIDIDGVAGLPPSFLEEAFGGMVRKGHLSRTDMHRLIKVRYANRELERYERSIWRYVDQAKRE
jgi:hypothetical protein